MNAENFAKLLKDPAQLHNMPYATLKRLVNEYPYCQNLRFLLLKKCAFEDHADFDRNLQLAATFSNDRSLLLKQLNIHENDFLNTKQETQDQEIVASDENVEKQLELETKEAVEEKHVVTDISVSENEPEDQVLNEVVEKIEEPEEKPVESEQTKEIKESPKYLDESELEAEIEDITEEVEFVLNIDASDLKAKEPEKDYEKVISFEELINLDTSKRPKKSVLEPNLAESKTSSKKNTAKKKTRKNRPPMPKSSFSSWVKQFQDEEELKTNKKKKHRKSKKKKPKSELLVIKNQKKKKQVKKKKKGVSFAENSLKENKEIVSETLANILASQGSHEKAIEMFEKLSLIIPEKSSYFADRIKKLKNN